MPDYFYLLIALAFGLVTGSFLSVCIYRIPLSRLDIWLENPEESKELIESSKDIGICQPPRSFCPTCKTQLLWWHNIPVLSFILLGGKCAFCGKRISIRYPLLEIISAGLAIASTLIFGFSVTALFIFIICSALIVITFIDYDLYIIPDVITLPGIIIGLLLSFVNTYWNFLPLPFVQHWIESIVGILIGSGFLFLVAMLYLLIRRQEGLGMGDVKLLGMLGAFFGFEAVLFTIFMGSLLGAVLGGTLILFKRFKFTHPLPFGPYLAAAAIWFVLSKPEMAFEIGEGFRFLFDSIF